MNQKFYPKKAHFESKSIVAPNALIFNKNLTETAKIFILVLHAIATCAPTWTPIQEDLKLRLGWGREKMDGAIACCVKFGYLKVKQARNKIGKFSHNEFIFDIDGQLLKYTDDETHPELYPSEEELKESLPLTGFPTSVETTSVNPPLPCISDIPISKREQQPKPLKSQRPSDVVVVPLSMSKLNISKEECEKIARVYPEEEIDKAVKNTLKVKERRSDAATLRWLLKCPNAWKEPMTQEKIESNNSEYLRTFERLDGKNFSGTTVQVGPKYIQFVTGQNLIRFEVNEKGFRNLVDEYLEKIGFKHV